MFVFLAQYSCKLKIMMRSMNKTSLKNSKYRGWSHHYQERLTLSLFIALLRSVFPHIHRILYKTIKNKNEGWRKAALRLDQIKETCDTLCCSLKSIWGEGSWRKKGKTWGTMNPGYWLEFIPWIIFTMRWCHFHWFQTGGATFIDSKFSHQMAPLSLARNLANMWCHLY